MQLDSNVSAILTSRSMCWLKKRKFNIDESDLGIIDDPRSLEERRKDYRAEELFEFAPIDWKEKPESEWRKYPEFNQDGSSSCLAQAEAKCLGIENALEEEKFNAHSAKDIYLLRKNYSDKGMYFMDALRIGHKVGACLEQQMPSQKLNETDMNLQVERTPSMKMVANILRGGNYLFLFPNIERIASVIEPYGKPVILGVEFGSYEWMKKVPKIKGTHTPYRHGIVGIEALIYKGKKAILIDDSARPDSGFEGRRILTEDWFKEDRIMFAGYHQFLANEGFKKKPKHFFQRDLYYGLRKDSDVMKLQECLSYLKMFPSNINFTGNFYGITLKAVQTFQTTYGIAKPSQLGFGRCGPKTRGKLNQLFK